MFHHCIGSFLNQFLAGVTLKEVPGRPPIGGVFANWLRSTSISLFWAKDDVANNAATAIDKICFMLFKLYGLYDYKQRYNILSGKSYVLKLV